MMEYGGKEGEERAPLSLGYRYTAQEETMEEGKEFPRPAAENST